MDQYGHSLARARRAYAAQDWRSAAAHFDAVPSERLKADDLAAYADAVWWLGRIEDNLRLGAAAYDAFLAESRSADAARIAMGLGIFHWARGDEPQGAGWLGRAGRLAGGIPECPVHGYLLSFTGVEASLLAGNLAAALDAARRVQTGWRSSTKRWSPSWTAGSPRSSQAPSTATPSRPVTRSRTFVG